jgi:hypothetical protein
MPLEILLDATLFTKSAEPRVEGVTILYHDMAIDHVTEINDVLNDSTFALSHVWRIKHNLYLSIGCLERSRDPSPAKYRLDDATM